MGKPVLMLSIALSADDMRRLDEYIRAELAAARGLLEECEVLFRWYGDLHAAKPDAEKAKRNYDIADKIKALKAAP